MQERKHYLLIPGKQKFEARILTSIVAPKSFSKLFQMYGPLMKDP